MSESSVIAVHEIDVREIDVHSEVAELAHDIAVAAATFERPHSLQPGRDERLAEWRFDDPAERLRLFGAWVDGHLAGVAECWIPMNDNTTKLWFEVSVHPDFRRRGAGRALIDRVRDLMAEATRLEAITDCAVPADNPREHPYWLFAEACGMSLGVLEIRRSVDLPLADSLLESLAQEARPQRRGYQVLSFLDGVPEPYQESLCAVMNQLGVDAPTGEIEFEAETMDPVRYRDYLQLEKEQGRTRLTTIAVDGEENVVAYTDLVLPAGSPTGVWQWGTLVHRDHRGHRLGMAIKVENLQWLQRDFPERTRVQTCNADANKWMVEINEQLGFQIIEWMPSFTLHPDTASVQAL